MCLFCEAAVNWLSKSRAVTYSTRARGLRSLTLIPIALLYKMSLADTRRTENK